jgi:hypothetical protein
MDGVSANSRLLRLGLVIVCSIGCNQGRPSGDGEASSRGSSSATAVTEHASGGVERAALRTTAPVPAQPSPNTASNPCAELCGRAAPLKCPGSTGCASRCEEMRTLPVCRAEMQAALECFVKVPLSGWECDEGGIPQVKEEQCDAEQGRVAKCMAAHQDRRR